jgi:hypothetical protein
MEMEAFIDSARRLGANQLMAFGTRNETKGIKGTNFPSVLHAAVALLKIKGKSKTVKFYKTGAHTAKASMIDALVARVEETYQEDLDLTLYRGDGAYDLAVGIPDLPAILSNLQIA